MKNGNIFKKSVRSFGIAVIVLFMLILAVSCSLNGENKSDEFVFSPPLEEIGKEYTVEDAENDGCVIMKDGDVSAGRDIWQSFCNKSQKGESSCVRLVHYHELDKDRVAAEYYEKIKDEYPVMYVFDLVYDGEDYGVRYFNDGEERVESFKHLLRYEGEFAPGMNQKTYLRYVLTNDDTITWSDIENSMVSSDYEKSQLFRQVMQVYIDVE